MIDVIFFYYILSFFDSSAVYYLISVSSLASHSIFFTYGRITVISIGSRVVITYIIRQTISLHGEHQYETNFQD